MQNLDLETSVYLLCVTIQGLTYCAHYSKLFNAPNILKQVSLYPQIFQYLFSLCNAYKRIHFTALKHQILR